MLLRAAIVMLVMLNLGAGGWWLWQPTASARTGAVNASGPQLHLVGEVTQPKSPVAAAPAPAATVVAPPAETAKPTAATASAVAATEATAVCLRFGPFADAAARETARGRLQQAGVSAHGHDERAREVRGWKVFLPPQASREAAQALAERIKATGVSDLLVMNQGEDSNSIALGRFGTEAAAQRRQAELVGKGFAAQVAAIGGTPAKVWLDARLPASADRVGLVRIAPARPLDCATLK